MDNVTAHVQRLQLGGLSSRQRRRARPSTASESASNSPHAYMRRLLTRGFRSADSATYMHQNVSNGCATPVFQVAFAPYGRAQSLLAAVDEDGFVSLVDTSRPPDAQATAYNNCSVFQRVHHKWQAHDNAVFDVFWARDSEFLLTASGDTRVCAWDVETKHARFVFEKGHTMSVKCVRQSSQSDDVFATGSRDGNVLLWDSRAPSTPVGRLLGVHNATAALQSPFKQTTRSPGASPGTPGSSTSFVSPEGSRKRRKIAAAGSTASPRSVTGLEFLASGYEVVTAGNGDGMIKIWDLRRLMEPRKIPLASRNCVTSSSLPVRALSCVSRNGSQRGITSLALDATRSRLLVSVVSDDLCVFDVGSRQSEPLLRLDGHIASSFYVKASFSPDGDFVASGSSSGAVFLWDTRLPASPTAARAPVAVLKGHSSESNGVAWHASDFTRLATSSDDGTVRVWSATRHAESQQDDFVLKRECHEWTNMEQLKRQRDGCAYAVEVTGEEEESQMLEPETPPTPSPPVIHRNATAMAPARAFAQPQSAAATPSVRTQPRRPPSKAAKTLLELWGR